jgi:hypothetical protein
MSKRIDFTEALAGLLQYMNNEGDSPILDFVKRSTEEQKRMFESHLSKCDGVRNISKHQVGLAADIYLIDDEGKLIDWAQLEHKSIKYHDFWEESGGARMISWDLGHFEWRT